VCEYDSWMLVSIWSAINTAMLLYRKFQRIRKNECVPRRSPILARSAITVIYTHCRERQRTVWAETRRMRAGARANVHRKQLRSCSPTIKTLPKRTNMACGKLLGHNLATDYLLDRLHSVLHRRPPPRCAPIDLVVRYPQLSLVVLIRQAS
jgi:hypothetical protein